MLTYKTKNFNCPLEFAIELIAGKWKPRILWFLRDKTLRFGELERLLPDTSRKVLILQLKELESDGLITRTVYPVVPSKVEYSLSERGKSLFPLLDSLRSWGSDHIEYLTEKLPLPV